MMALPRIFAELRPQHRQRLSGYRYMLVTPWNREALDKLEDFQPGSTNARLRKVNKLSLIARKRGKWALIFTSDDEAATWARVALLASPIPNPNVSGQIGLDDPTPVLKQEPDVGRRRSVT